MLEKKSYWWIIAGTCMGGALAVQACTVTTSTDASGGANAGGSAGSGTAGTAGTTAGASGTSGTAGASGSSSGSAGTAGSSGSGTVPYDCDPDATTEPTPAASCDPTVGVPGATNDACMQCVINNATTCADFKACFGAYANGHGDQCGYGSPISIGGILEGEFYCYVDCMKSTSADAGVGDADGCNSMCATVVDSNNMTCPMGGSGMGIRTYALIADLAATSCSTDCGITPSQ